MQKEQLFYFRAGECLAAIDMKNMARSLLSKQVKLRYPKGRKPTPEEYAAITNELKTVQLGVEKTNESILGFKIRKQKECQALISKTAKEFPEFRHVLNSMIKERSTRLGNEKLNIQRLQSLLRRAVYELFTPYKENCIEAYDVINEILVEVPHIKMVKETKGIIQISLSKIEMMELYHPEEYEEMIGFIHSELSPFYNPESTRFALSEIPSEQLPYFVSETVIERFRKLFFYEDKSKALGKLHEKQAVRMQRFMKAYTELQNSIK